MDNERCHVRVSCAGFVRCSLPVVFAFIVFSVHAQIVADPNAPGVQRPTILTAPNGVPLVNIQTPSAAGVSRNGYRQFDVNGEGAILNNSRGSAQTQLGGWVAGNPWLVGGSARVILNEINSVNPSHLNGYVEIAGSRAELVIANPAGIACDGCGFINAHRATLSAGAPIINNGALTGYRIADGAINIHGAGLDARDANYTDLIARSVQVNAGIWAQRACQYRYRRHANRLSRLRAGCGGVRRHVRAAYYVARHGAWRGRAQRRACWRTGGSIGRDR